MNKNNIPLDYLEGYENKRVLIVDDDAGILRILKQGFRKNCDFEVKTATSGFEAGVLAGEMRPHVICVDSALDGISGQELIKTLKKTPELKRIKVISISGKSFSREQVRKQGFDMHVQKPFRFEELIDAVNSVLGLT